MEYRFYNIAIVITKYLYIQTYLYYYKIKKRYRRKKRYREETKIETEIKNVINRLNAVKKTDSDGKNKYFSFGLSVLNNEKNAEQINDLKLLIRNAINVLYGKNVTDVKNINLITDLLIYVAKNGGK